MFNKAIEYIHCHKKESNEDIEHYNVEKKLLYMYLLKISR